MASISNPPSIIAPVPFQPRIVVSNELLAKSLAGRFQSLGSSVEVDSDIILGRISPFINKNGVNSYEYGDYSFIRDRQITLHDDTIYIPSSNNKFDMMLHKSALPSSSKKFMNANEASYGVGFDLNRFMQILSYAKKNQLKFKLGRTRIEGGNARLFKDTDWNRKALIGSHSLIASMLALDEIHYFTSERLKKYTDKIKAPSLEALRRARNMHMCHEFEKLWAPFDDLWEKIDELTDKDLVKKLRNQINENFTLYVKSYGFANGIESFYEKMHEPVSEDDKAKYAKDAIILMAKIQLTKKVIAAELSIPIENIAFLAQDRFHIDQDCFVLSRVGPGGTVFYHDEFETQKVLLKLFHETRDALVQKRLRNYLEASKNRYKENAEITEINRKKLAKIHCRAIPIPGVFEAPGEPTINFMNGFEHRGIFFTNGSKEEMFESAFKEAVKKSCPEADIRFVDVRKGEGMMEFFLTQTNGGLNCMTWTYNEQPESFIPLKPLEKEVEPWEMSQLGDISSLVASYLGDPNALSAKSTPKG